MRSKRVAITGMGVVSGLGNSPELLHKRLCEQQVGYSWIKEYAGDGFTPRQGGFIPDFKPEQYLQGKLLRPLDRIGRLVASAAKLALDDSGWTAEMLKKNEAGLVLGTMFSSMHTITQFDWHALTEGPSCASPMDFANTVINSGAGQSAIWHKLCGINSTIATGATSGLMAIGYATDLIAEGLQSAVLAGGADQLCFESFCAFELGGFLHESTEKDACAIPFSATRNGFALTEACALVMLEEWDTARNRGAHILGEILGHSSAYGPASSIPYTKPDSIVRAMKGALQRSNIKPAEVHTISAAANGSVTADRNEALAIQSVFGNENPDVPVTAIKAMLGENLGASGALQTIAMLEGMHKSELSGIHGLNQIDPVCGALNLSDATRSMPIQTGLINSVGLDGHACSLLVQQPAAITG